MNLASLRTEILREYREYDTSSPVSVSATEVNTYINWGYQNFCVIAQPKVTSATRAVTPGNAIYYLPNDCIIPFEVYCGSSRLDCKNYWEKDEQDPRWRSSGNKTLEEYIPLSYNQLETHPKSTVAATLTWYYRAMPATVTAAVDFDIKTSEIRSLKDFVLAVLHLKGRVPDMATKYLKRFFENRQRFVRATNDTESSDKSLSLRRLPWSTYNSRKSW